jgi:hypothetical protein
MRIVLALVLALMAASLPAAAQDYGRPLAQVGLQPLPDTPTPDIDLALKTYWPAYFNSGAKFGFFRDQVRAGRIDLDEDGKAELFIIIDSPDWQSDKGFPMLVARWTAKGWSAIGWGFGDSDQVFVTGSRVDGWATIETPSQWLRWNGASYQALDRPARN